MLCYPNKGKTRYTYFLYAKIMQSRQKNCRNKTFFGKKDGQKLNQIVYLCKIIRK